MYICICMYSRVEQILQKWRRVEWESHVRSSSHRYFDGYAEHVENYLFLITDILNIFSDQAPLIIVSRLLLGEKECSYIYIYIFRYMLRYFFLFLFFFRPIINIEIIRFKKSTIVISKAWKINFNIREYDCLVDILLNNNATRLRW